MRKQYWNSLWLLLLLAGVIVRFVAANPLTGKDRLLKDSAATSRLSSYLHLSHSEAEEGSNINEVTLGIKLPVAEAIVHFGKTGSILPSSLTGLVRWRNNNVLIAPLYRCMLFPFHVFW